MKNVTFSVDEALLNAARARARARNTSLNEEFRRWLAEFSSQDGARSRFEQTVDRIARSTRTGGRRFTREEMNAR